jgi:CheY-like chemotaxis protein
LWKRIHSAAARARAECDELICALTGWGQEEDRERSQAAGIDRHLVKPLDYDTLQSLLEQPAFNPPG